MLSLIYKTNVFIKLLNLMMTKIMLLFSSIFMTIGVFTFVANRKHLLSMLLSLEFLVLSLYLILFMFLVENFMEMSFMIIFLSLSVCEGALGLSMLVSMIRTHGNDYFQSISILKC
nr:NADH dehydrogenase subunit 4L [Renocera pallida]